MASPNPAEEQNENANDGVSNLITTLQNAFDLIAVKLKDGQNDLKEAKILNENLEQELIDAESRITYLEERINSLETDLRWRISNTNHFVKMHNIAKQDAQDKGTKIHKYLTRLISILEERQKQAEEMLNLRHMLVVNPELRELREEYESISRKEGWGKEDDEPQPEGRGLFD